MDEAAIDKGAVNVVDEIEREEAKRENSEQLQRPQVAAFTTKGQLGSFASKLQLTRIPLAELRPGTLLTDAYVGGKVISIFSAHLTQGSVVLLLQDDPRSEKYAQCVMSGDVTRLLPCSTQLGISEVYVHGGRVGHTTVECSQELEVELLVSGEEGKVWIVNREAESGSFLPARDPNEFHGRGGNAKKAKRQRHMKAGLERGGLANKATAKAEQKATTSSESPAVQSTTAHPSPSCSPALRRPTPPSMSPQSVTATHYASGPSPPPSYTPRRPSPSVPHSLTGNDHSSSAKEGQSVGHQGSHKRQSVEEKAEEEEEEEIEADNTTSSDGKSSASDESQDESSSDGRNSGKQDRTLFPYQSRSTKEYTYRKVAELEAGLQKTNVFGVVVDFQPPFQTKGRDICSIVNITDESLVGDQSFKCTFFHQNREKLPKIDKVGDVVSFHRINVKLFPNGVQGIGQNFSSSQSFSGRLGSKVKPRTGSVSYTFTPCDKRRVKELRLWYARKCRRPHPCLRPLKDVSLSTTPSDVVCQVLSVSLSGSESQSHTAVLGIWDGTRTRHRSLALNLSSYNTTMVTDSELVRIAESFSESVVVYGRDLVEVAASITPGQYVCLQNLLALEHSGQRNAFKDVFSSIELSLRPSSVTAAGRKAAIKVLQSSDIEVFELKKMLKKFSRQQSALVRPLPPDIVPSTITGTRHGQQQPTTPLGALKHFPDAPTKFVCVVKVLGIKPGSVEEMVQLRCPGCREKTTVTTSSGSSDDLVCRDCLATTKDQKRRRQKSPTMQPVYFFKLVLADETGHVEVFVSGQQATKFLSGFPPAVFSQRPQQRMSLINHLYTLTGGNDPFDTASVAFPRPWVAVCLISMHSNNGSLSDDTRSVISYHLFDTVLQNNTL